MHFWKFNKSLPETEPGFEIPTFEKIKAEYKRNSTAWWFSNVFSTGILRIAGWAFDFRDELKKYIVKRYDGMLYEVWAPNRTSVRKQVHHKIYYIADVPTGKI